MKKPKRHHWWPMAQSQHWTDGEGHIFATRRNGSVFQPNIINIGVESELYTRFYEDDAKDTSIEEWFAETIDGPATAMINFLLDPAHIRRRLFPKDPERAKLPEQLGFRIHNYIEYLKLPDEIRTAIASYLAALLVRHPLYLAKLVNFHEESAKNKRAAKNNALQNMLYLYDVYVEEIRKSCFLVLRRASTSEFLYSDGGVTIDEPWNPNHGVPFDMHAPITPDVAIEVIRANFNVDLETTDMVEVNNRGVARQNRIVLADAQRFVFSRQPPPVDFIVKNFGVPAPKDIGHRVINGNLEVKYDPSRRQR